MPTRHVVPVLTFCLCTLLAPLGPSASAEQVYTVRPGDTLWGIAGRLGVTVRSLAAANSLAPTAIIHPGQRIMVPEPSSRATPTRSAASAPTPGDAEHLGRAPHPLRAGRVYIPVRSSLPSRGAAFTSAIVRTALRFLGRPYQWSGIGNRGFDCSGLVFRVFAAMGLVIPHSSFDQYRAGVSVPPSLLSPGDLVFFRTYNSGPSHVGIYVGADRFIHASYSRGVVLSSMQEPYYRSRFLGARRL